MVNNSYLVYGFGALALGGLYKIIRHFFILARLQFKKSILRLFNYSWVILASVIYFLIGVFSFPIPMLIFLTLFVFGIIGYGIRSETVLYIQHIWKGYHEFDDLKWVIHDWSATIISALIELSLMDTSLEDTDFEINVHDNRFIECTLVNGTRYDEQLFMTSLNELTSPIDNPRYLLAVTHDRFGELPELTYFAVPEVFGRKKSDAEAFLGNWQAQGGDGELVYTRTFAGRKHLAKARIRHLNGQKAKRLSVWK